MAEQKHDDNGLDTLRRMIAYVREEALRLRIMEVAMLLEHAETAVTAFAPVAAADPGGDPLDRAVRRVQH